MITPFTQAEPRLAFNFAPSIKHDSLAKMSQAQKEQALHEFIDMRDLLKAHIFNPVASPQSRIFALGTFFDRATMTAYHRLDDVTGQAPVWIGDKDKEGSLSHRLGMSRNAISNELTALEKAHLAKRFYRKSGDGNEHLDVSISEQLLTHPELLPAKGERPRRPPQKCKECGDTALIARVSCLNCGCVNHEHLINDEETEQEPEGFPDTAPVGEVLSIQEIPPEDEREPEQAQQPLCTRDVQSVSDLSNTITDCTRDVHNGAAADSAVPVEERDTSTTTGAVSGIPDLGTLSPEQILWQAACLLVEIAGTEAQTRSYGKMLRSGDDKYTTVYGHLRPGRALVHLKGIETFTARLGHEGGKTRALCFDVDNERGWQLLQQAARQLAIMDFNPILEPSPATGKHAGGGHLWIIFDGLVDAYSAIQTVYQYAPQVREIDEYWPSNTPIRLPGGKYIYQCEPTWCKLYNAQCEDLSHDGMSAASALLHHLSSAELVNAYEQPAPIAAQEDAPVQKDQPHGQSRARDIADEHDLIPEVIDQFNAAHSWDWIAAKCGGWKGKKFAAVWRNDGTPNVSLDPETNRAKDFSRNAWIDKPMDQYQVYCLLQGGTNWEAFRRRDLNERCQKLRELPDDDLLRVTPQEQALIDAAVSRPAPALQPAYDEQGLPTRMTLCCGVPFQFSQDGGFECSHPACPEKAKRCA